MSKRKLTRRQNWRIQKIQDERTARAARKDAQIDSQLDNSELGPEQAGLIISHYGKQVDIEPEQPEFPGEIIRCHLRTNLGQLVTGDRIIWRRGKETGVVVAALPRSSELLRPNPYGEMKPVAANIDSIIITVAVEPTPHANLIDRYLVAAELSQIEPVILLNKTDLLNDNNREVIDALLDQYRVIGYQVLTASSSTEEGLEPLKNYLHNRINVFVGQSGVGKSSLINALLPGVDLKTGELSTQSRKGRHTTTTARLFHFPDGGDLIDSPGIREFGLWHIKAEDVIDGFRELRPLAGLCRFRDCKHEQEPNCALLEAVEKGDVSVARWNSYRNILGSIEMNG
ncbi:small ribosomal subunit biogenesis GTPase RsgA [Neptuniibacter sp. CAU 1671]|uniref:small ribosomal subunit biogenesis GTPase RsgA n=1 Tax=Neptuniibacter sp. CAU 1671 TaxID=3032593 RepID=UPI0023DB944C|nr:small ribosomal subunit biogenesis GTPase RsgA [Neptuniibacter sp. CAU 1671]MDF2181903.1 small ribosomal subunit biogenesis GTPase RsgA [Neptuniibacter sp. CAU 1671]